MSHKEASQNRWPDLLRLLLAAKILLILFSALSKIQEPSIHLLRMHPYKELQGHQHW